VAGFFVLLGSAEEKSDFTRRREDAKGEKRRKVGALIPYFPSRPCAFA
jgi:hypothetical protein